MVFGLSWAETKRRVGVAGRNAPFLFPFACMYAAYGATFGVIGGAAPLVLRARGMALADVGLLQLIYLPIGVAFLWAPLIDRWQIPGLPHRIGWIVAAQASTAALLLLLSLGNSWPIAILFTLALGTSVTMATADVALEALIVETVDMAHRPLVTTTKLSGSAIGTMIGVALATMFSAHVDLARAVLIVALVDACLLLPMLRYPERQRRLAIPVAIRKRPTRQRLVFLARRAAVLGFFFAPAIMIVSVPGLVLLDLKLSLATVGFYTGTLTTIISLMMTLTSGALLMRIAAHRLVATFATGVAFSAILFAIATALSSKWLGYCAAVLNVTCECGLGVPVFNAIYQWSEGEHAATDYSFMFGIAFLVSFPARVFAPGLAAHLGWPAYFLLFAPVYALAVGILAAVMARSGPSKVQTPAA